MKRTLLTIAALSVLSLTACGRSGSDTPSARAKAAESAGKSQTTAGSIDFTITAETINTNSKGDTNGHQCQLAFVATNRSGVDVSSMIIESDALPAGGGAPVGSKLNLTMPMEAKAGASQEAWGNVTVDNFACETLRLSFPPQSALMCRTRTKVACAAYRFHASGIAVAG